MEQVCVCSLWKALSRSLFGIAKKISGGNPRVQENITCCNFSMISSPVECSTRSAFLSNQIFSLVRYLGSKFASVTLSSGTKLSWLSRQILRLTKASGFQLKACACRLPNMAEIFLGVGGWRDVKEFSIRCCVLI